MHANDNGCQVLARFDAKLDIGTSCGAALARAADINLTVWSPTSKQVNRPAVAFTPEARERLRAVAA